jgi:hypothetical protein
LPFADILEGTAILFLAIYGTGNTIDYFNKLRENAKKTSAKQD